MQIPNPISDERLARALGLLEECLTDSEDWEPYRLYDAMQAVYEELGGDLEALAAPPAPCSSHIWRYVSEVGLGRTGYTECRVCGVRGVRP